jgi:hypothetical protein
MDHPLSAPDAEYPTSGVIRLDEVEKEALAGAGNYLYLIPWGGGRVVAKIYYGSRSTLEYVGKSLGNLVGRKSSQFPRTRWRTEQDSIDVWESHGFRCFRRYPDIEIAELPRQGYMVFEYLPGLHFRDYFRDETVPFEDRMTTWRRWIPEWCRRHRAAIDECDPRLIQENGDVKHVMLVDDEYLYFDFEMVFKSRRTRPLVGREILAYMRSVGRFFGEATYDRMMDELVEHYPDKVLLLSAWETAWRHPNPVWRVARALDRLKRTNRKRFSKYRVALDLRHRLDACSLTHRR